MQADQILNHYAAGERNFCGVDLRGQRFKGQTLAGADFSQADIRGADFSQANLSQANFSQSRAGLTPHQTGIRILGSWLLSGIAGVLIGLALYVSLGVLIPASMLMQKMGDDYVPGVEWAIRFTPVFAIGWLVSSRQLEPVRVGLLGGIVTLVCVGLALVNAAGYPLADLFLIAILAAWVGSLALDTFGAIATALLKAIVNKSMLLIGIGIAISAIAAIGTIDFINAEHHLLNPGSGLEALINGLRLLLPIAAATYSAWIGVGIFQGKDPRPWSRKLVVAWAAMKGTSFHHANLSDANFTGAWLPNTNLQAADVTRTIWRQARRLDLARIETTSLTDPQVHRLLISGRGQGQNLDSKDLSGVNLQDADLTGASLISANLNEAYLAGANLSQAKLVRSQLYRANLSNAILTGAYIQDWGISTDTCFDGVKCDYVYMRLPTPADPDPCRKPDNRNESFAAGDFVNFIAPIIKTLDLYNQQNVDPRHVAEAYKTIDLFHHEGIDPGAAAIALQQLAEQHPEAGIEVVALEGRGQDQIRLQAVVSSQSDRSALSAQYSENYRQLKALPYGDLQTLLTSVADKDHHIQRLETMLEQAIQQPRFYVETYRHQGEVIMSQSQGNIHIEGVQGNVSGVAAAGEQLDMTGALLGEISGTVTNTIQQLPAASDPNQPGLRELLLQLQAAIAAAPELNNEDKAEAMEQVKVLAEAGQAPAAGPLQKAAKTAMKILKGTIASLPGATALVKESGQLLQAISALLAIA